MITEGVGHTWGLPGRVAGELGRGLRRNFGDVITLGAGGPEGAYGAA